MTELLTQSARRLRRFGLAAAIVVVGVLPIAFTAGPAAATQAHGGQNQNGCVNWKYTRDICYLSLSTGVTTPGSTITVWGAGYKADSTVWLSLDPDWQSSQAHNPHFRHSFSLTSVTTNHFGKFSTQVTIPGNAPAGGSKVVGAGTNPVGGTLVLSANLWIKQQSSPGPVGTTTTVSESKSWAPYGHEDKVSFGVDVTPTGGGKGPTGDVVTIDVGTASCVATLTAGQGWCSISPTALPIGTGYAVTAAFTGDASFDPSASTNTVDFAVTKEYQSIDFGWLYGTTLSHSPVTVSATASSGLPVTFTTSTPTVCTAGGTDGATITLLTPGKCIVVASQDGSAIYAPASPVAEFFTIPKTYHFHHHH